VLAKQIKRRGGNSWTKRGVCSQRKRGLKKKLKKAGRGKINSREAKFKNSAFFRGGAKRWKGKTGITVKKEGTRKPEYYLGKGEKKSGGKKKKT